MAQSLAENIRGLDRSWEWGALIYILDGELHSTTIITQQSSTEIGFPYGSNSYLPDGAHIVGWIHSHPDIPGQPPQMYMSGDDMGARQTMLDHADGRYTVAENLMSYVVAMDDHRLYEFDQDDGEGELGTNVTPCGGFD